MHNPLVKFESHPAEVGILWTHEDQVLALTTGKSVPLAHHERHVVEFVHFECIEDQVDEFLVHVIHLNDKVCLINWCTVTTECTGDFSNFDHINYVICSWLYWFSGGLLFIIYKFLRNRYIDNKNIVLIVFLWRNLYLNWIYYEMITFCCLICLQS